MNEFWGNEGQSEHGWKSQVRSEAEHFTENRLLAVAVVCNLCQNRLCYTVDGTAYQGSAHRVPLVGLGVEPYILRQEESSDDSRKDIVVGLYEDIGQQDFATESEHLFQRAEIQVESRSPRREVPETEIDDCNVYQTLGRDAPVGHAVVGHEDTDRTRYDQCRNLGDGFLFYHQVTEQVGTVGRCTAGNDKSQKCEPCQWYQVRLPVVGCNERGTENRMM